MSLAFRVWRLESVPPSGRGEPGSGPHTRYFACGIPTLCLPRATTGGCLSICLSISEQAIPCRIPCMRTGRTGLQQLHCLGAMLFYRIRAQNAWGFSLRCDWSPRTGLVYYDPNREMSGWGIRRGSLPILLRRRAHRKVITCHKNVADKKVEQELRTRGSAPGLEAVDRSESTPPRCRIVQGPAKRLAASYR